MPSTSTVLHIHRAGGGPRWRSSSLGLAAQRHWPRGLPSPHRAAAAQGGRTRVRADRPGEDLPAKGREGPEPGRGGGDVAVPRGL